MQNFLSNIGVGVFSLQDVLDEGLDAVVPQGLQNQAKQQKKQLDEIGRQQKRLKSLLQGGTLSGEQRSLVEERINKLKKEYWTQRKQAQQKEIDRKVRGQSAGGALQNFATTWTGRGAVALGGAVARSIQKTFSNITQQVGETGFLSDRLIEDFDRVASASRETVMSGEKLFNTVDDNFDTFLGLRREFGHIESYSVKTLDNITQLEDTIGLSSEEATDLLSTFKGINRQSIQTNTTMIQTFSLLANEEGVAFRDVMQDITDNAEFFSTYMSTSSEDMDNLIIKAQKLGTSFSDFTQVFESFSDIESTIEKQARMSIFANRRFDFLSVLEQLQQGNVGQAQSSIMNQLGGIDQGTFDNPFVKRQLSEGFGVDSKTLNKLFKASNNQMSNREVVDRDFTDELATFNENFKQLGFGTIKKYFTQYFLTPLNQLFKQNTESVQDIFEGIGGIIKKIGQGVELFSKGMIKIQEFTGSVLASLGTAVATIGAVGVGIKTTANLISDSIRKMVGGYAIDTQQLGVLRDIRTILASDMGGVENKSSGNFGVMSGKSGKAVGLAGGALLGLGTGYMGYQEGKMSLGGALNATIAGGGTGAMYGAMGGPWGAGISGLVGAGIGLGSYALGTGLGESKPDSTTVKQNRGGIFTKRYTGKMDVGETGKPEGFVPLETQDGKPTMPADLSDRTIKKLAGAMSKMKFQGIVEVDGKKKTIDFYNHAMNPSSALNV